MKASLISQIIVISVFILVSSCGQTSNSPLQGELIDNKIDPFEFEILTTDHYPAVQNFYVLVKFQTLSQDSIQNFVDRFRTNFCTQQCNIHLYDDNSIKPLVTKYPLENSEYLKVADHYLAASTFDSPEVWLYPFQDIKYKELGGKNLKKD